MEIVSHRVLLPSFRNIMWYWHCYILKNTKTDSLDFPMPFFEFLTMHISSWNCLPYTFLSIWIFNAPQTLEPLLHNAFLSYLHYKYPFLWFSIHSFDACFCICHHFLVSVRFSYIIDVQNCLQMSKGYEEIYLFPDHVEAIVLCYDCARLQLH